jgi:hypothetical protein
MTPTRLLPVFLPSFKLSVQWYDIQGPLLAVWWHDLIGSTAQPMIVPDHSCLPKFPEAYDMTSPGNFSVRLLNHEQCAVGRKVCEQVVLLLWQPTGIATSFCKLLTASSYRCRVLSLVADCTYIGALKLAWNQC